MSSEQQLGNCARCSKPIVKSKLTDLCRDCFEEQIDAYERIERVLEEEDSISVEEIAARANVSESLVKKLIQEGRIPTTLIVQTQPCKKCGGVVNGVGPYCSTCLFVVLNLVRDAADTVRAHVEKEHRRRQPLTGTPATLQEAMRLKRKKAALTHSNGSPFAPRSKYSQS